MTGIDSEKQEGNAGDLRRQDKFRLPISMDSKTARRLKPDLDECQSPLAHESVVSSWGLGD